ncbi:MAG: S16 family serine protease, partial [Deltaproteobacteria bacterium]|nr:S16 family serine protease [Deltaproteobacteria bacterium]
IIPKENEKDLKEIPKNILKDLTIIPVDHMDEVLKNALVLKDPGSLFKKKEEDLTKEGEPPFDPPPPSAAPTSKPGGRGLVM